jgi:hypothetical protein
MMDQPDYDEEFLPPTWEAFDDALRIIVEAGAIIGSVFPLGDACPDGAGGLRTSWRHGARQVRLVIPSTSAQSPYIHWQQDKTPNVGKNPTGETLAERLAWMIDNDDRTVTM